MPALNVCAGMSERRRDILTSVSLSMCPIGRHENVRLESRTDNTEWCTVIVLSQSRVTTSSNCWLQLGCTLPSHHFTDAQWASLLELPSECLTRGRLLHFVRSLFSLREITKPWRRQFLCVMVSQGRHKYTVVISPPRSYQASVIIAHAWATRHLRKG